VLYSPSALPLVWDQASERGKNPRTDAFLKDAVAHGVGSGVAFPVYAGYPARTLVSLNSAEPLIGEARRAQIAANLGDIVLFGQSFHEIFVRGVIEKGIAPQFEGAPLSGRERQCLQMAAHGMTGAEIAFKLGISERTVTFHFANITSKLGVLNRHEAIAKSIAQGVIGGSPGPAGPHHAWSMSPREARRSNARSRAASARVRRCRAHRGDGERRGAGVSRELDVRSRVADHQRLRGDTPTRFISCSSMLDGAWESLIGATRRREETADPVLRERPVACARLAGRDAQHEAGRRELGEQFAHPDKARSARRAK
jgi:DNA-binding CsgD family transcriptional regulator